MSRELSLPTKTLKKIKSIKELDTDKNTWELQDDDPVEAELFLDAKKLLTRIVGMLAKMLR